MLKTQNSPARPASRRLSCMAALAAVTLFGSVEVKAQTQHTITYVADSALTPCKVSQPGCVLKGQVVIETPRYCVPPQPIDLMWEQEICYAAKTFKNVGGNFVYSVGVSESRRVATNLNSNVLGLLAWVLTFLMLFVVQKLMGPHSQSQDLKTEVF